MGCVCILIGNGKPLLQNCMRSGYARRRSWDWTSRVVFGGSEGQWSWGGWMCGLKYHKHNDASCQWYFWQWGTRIDALGCRGGGDNRQLHFSSEQLSFRWSRACCLLVGQLYLQHSWWISHQFRKNWRSNWGEHYGQIGCRQATSRFRKSFSLLWTLWRKFWRGEVELVTAWFNVRRFFCLMVDSRKVLPCGRRTKGKFDFCILSGLSLINRLCNSNRSRTLRLVFPINEHCDLWFGIFQTFKHVCESCCGVYSGVSSTDRITWRLLVFFHSKVDAPSCFSVSGICD